MLEADFARVIKARKLYKALGTPTTEDLKVAIRMNLIKDIKITSKDLDLAEKAFGSETGNLKGKTIRSTPGVVQDKTIEILKELLNINYDII